MAKEILEQPFEVTTDTENFEKYKGPKINYTQTRVSDAEFRISPADLLFETGIREQTIRCFEVNGYKAFFKTEGDFPFDVFAAAFYLMSRYEEYLPHQKDSYGRYGHENSLAFKENFLDQPLINIWIVDLKKALKERFPLLPISPSGFTFLPTYDIDEAYCYKHKQWWRTVGGLSRSIVTGQWRSAGERIKVLSGRKKDPYDVFDWMNRENEKYRLKPVYFFLLAGKTGRYDKNIPPHKRGMKQLILAHSRLYQVGIHPSWQTGDDPEKLKWEISNLSETMSKAVVSSRQHYIRFTLPQTLRQLIDCGIKFDFSMGYGTINGFRASIASAFNWYDLEKETQTKLLLYPFCFMESNSFYEQKFSAQQALEELHHYLEAIKSVNGMMVTIWHNNFFGTAGRFKGWKQVYEQFLSWIPLNGSGPGDTNV